MPLLVLEYESLPNSSLMERLHQHSGETHHILAARVDGEFFELTGTRPLANLLLP